MGILNTLRWVAYVEYIEGIFNYRCGTLYRNVPPFSQYPSLHHFVMGIIEVLSPRVKGRNSA